MRIGHDVALTHFKILDALERKSSHVGSFRGFDAKKINLAYIFEHIRRTGIFVLHENLYVVHLDALHVANEESVRRCIAEPPRFRIPLPLLFGRFKSGLCSGATAAMLDDDVTQLNVLDRMAWEPT